jgi:hypothetical protein
VRVQRFDAADRLHDTCEHQSLARMRTSSPTRSSDRILVFIF